MKTITNLYNPTNSPNLANSTNSLLKVSNNHNDLKGRRSYIQVTLTNGRRLKLRTAIRK